MSFVNFKEYAAKLLKAQYEARTEGRLCPMACRSKGGSLVCIGRNGEDSRRVSVVDEYGMVYGINPNNINSLDDCPVVTFPKERTIKI